MCFSPKGSEHARVDQRFWVFSFLFLSLILLYLFCPAAAWCYLMKVRGRLENVLIGAKGREEVGSRQVLKTSWGSTRNLDLEILEESWI